MNRRRQGWSAQALERPPSSDKILKRSPPRSPHCACSGSALRVAFRLSCRFLPGPRCWGIREAIARCNLSLRQLKTGFDRAWPSGCWPTRHPSRGFRGEQRELPPRALVSCLDDVWLLRCAAGTNRSLSRIALMGRWPLETMPGSRRPLIAVDIVIGCYRTTDFVAFARSHAAGPAGSVRFRLPPWRRRAPAQVPSKRLFVPARPEFRHGRSAPRLAALITSRRSLPPLTLHRFPDSIPFGDIDHVTVEFSERAAPLCKHRAPATVRHDVHDVA